MLRTIQWPKKHSKKLAQAVEHAQEQRVWAFDEHRIGLKPILRRVWAKRGQRPVVSVQPRYEWRYLHGFVEPRSGETFWWLTSWVDVEAFNLVQLLVLECWIKPGDTAAKRCRCQRASP